MISFGRNIVSPNDSLIRINIEKLNKMITGESKALVELISKLRTMATLDQKRYNQLKIKLPYVVTGLFHPPYRKTENFASIQYFMLDFDHLIEKELDAETVKERVINDKHIVLGFISPSNDGIKLLMKLSKPCYDPGLYQTFYKLFSHKFSTNYHLQQVIDMKTSDVTRACFLSYDENPIFNSDAIPIELEKYVNLDSSFEVKKELQIIKKEEQSYEQQPLLKKQILPDEILQDIRSKLNPNIKIKEEKKIEIPKEIEAVMQEIESIANEAGVALTNCENIQYGRKLKFETGGLWAEINVFYGKKGFSVVKTPKRGSNDELATLCHQLVCSVVITQ